MLHHGSAIRTGQTLTTCIYQLHLRIVDVCCCSWSFSTNYLFEVRSFNGFLWSLNTLVLSKFKINISIKQLHKWYCVWCWSYVIDNNISKVNMPLPNDCRKDPVMEKEDIWRKSLGKQKSNAMSFRHLSHDFIVQVLSELILSIMFSTPCRQKEVQYLHKFFCLYLSLHQQHWTNPISPNVYICVCPARKAEWGYTVCDI